MFLSSLFLQRFRNYAQLQLRLENGPVVITGHNGAGKTNILEAISFLTPGRGLRRIALLEADRCSIQEKELPWAIHAEIVTATGTSTLGTARDGEKRQVKIDGKVRPQSYLTQAFAALWLTPQMDGLFLASDGERRRFLDRLVFAYDPQHAMRVNAYEKVMAERNRLLAGRSYDGRWLTALERTMAEQAVAIATARRETVAHLNEAMQTMTFSFPKAEMMLSGRIEERLNQGAPAQTIEEESMQTLHGARTASASSGRCATGLHRSVLSTRYAAKNMAAEQCSTGEQKALLLSIVLAQALAVKNWKNVTPVLLLDEVVAHLDAGRRAELCELLLSMGCQCFLTGTDEMYFEALESRAQRFAVESGTVYRE